MMSLRFYSSYLFFSFFRSFNFKERYFFLFTFHFSLFEIFWRVILSVFKGLTGSLAPIVSSLFYSSCIFLIYLLCLFLRMHFFCYEKKTKKKSFDFQFQEFFGIRIP